MKNEPDDSGQTQESPTTRQETPALPSLDTDSGCDDYADADVDDEDDDLNLKTHTYIFYSRSSNIDIISFTC